VPARQLGWMCECGVRLKQNEGQVECEACGAKYFVNDKQCKPL